MAFPKQDQRPKRGLWVPGDYLGRCINCTEKFIGDKRAVWCADCAYAADPCPEQDTSGSTKAGDQRGNPSTKNEREHPSDLVLYIAADHPDETDRQAEAEVKAFAPGVTICRVEEYTDMSTPRLLAGRSFYRGLASIRAFIDQWRHQ